MVQMFILFYVDMKRDPTHDFKIINTETVHLRFKKI
jgi:hypothetical protein